MGNDSRWSKIRKDGLLTIIGLTREYDVEYEDGDVNVVPDDEADILIRDRGAVVGFRRGDYEPFQISMTVDLRQFTDGTEDTIVDVLMGLENWLNESIAEEGFEGHFTDAMWNIGGALLGDAADNTITGHTIRWRQTGYADGDPLKAKFSGIGLEGHTVTGPA